MPETVPCLWFDGQAEEAAEFYCSVFPNSAVTHVQRSPEGSPFPAPFPAGTAMTVEFELDGRPFTALNGGPEFAFSEATSASPGRSSRACCAARARRPGEGEGGRRGDLLHEEARPRGAAARLRLGLTHVGSHSTGHSTGSPSPRAMSIRCTSEVPSPISRIFASR